MSDLKSDETGASIVPVLACVLNQLCTRNDRLNLGVPPPSAPGSPQSGMSKFHALRPPAIGIKDYLSRIGKYAACSGECFVLSLVYIDRIIQSNPNFVVNSLNIHRLLITSIMLAAKFFDDQYYNNAYYAKVGGVPTGEVNALEVEFLFMANFTLFVTADTYQQYYTELCNHSANVNNTCQCAQSPTKIPPLVIPQWPQLRDVDESELFLHVLSQQHPPTEESAYLQAKIPWMSIRTDEETDAHGNVYKISASSTSAAPSNSSPRNATSSATSSSAFRGPAQSSNPSSSNTSSQPMQLSSNTTPSSSTSVPMALSHSHGHGHGSISVPMAGGLVSAQSSSAALMGGTGGGLASSGGSSRARASAVGAGLNLNYTAASANALIAARGLQSQGQQDVHMQIASPHK